MGSFKDLTGKRFGRLTVIKRASDYVSPKNHNLIRWLCHCDCGNDVIVNGTSLKRKGTQSCGCLQKELAANKHTKHGKYGCRLYRIWIAMNQRCYNPNSTEYNIYGGECKTVCDEWKHDFQAFYDWSMANGYDETLTIDRIDVNGNYEPSNCRWATNKEQQNNRSNNHLITFNGKTQTIAQWANELNINYSTLSARINNYHWDIEKALSTKPTYCRVNKND